MKSCKKSKIVQDSLIKSLNATANICKKENEYITLTVERIVLNAKEIIRVVVIFQMYTYATDGKINTDCEY